MCLKISLAIITAALSADEALDHATELAKQAENINVVINPETDSFENADFPVVIPGCLEDAPDDDSGLTVYRGWLRCAGYHQIDIIVFASNRADADRLASIFEREVNKLPNKRKDIFESDTLEYGGQIVYEDLSPEDLEKQRQSAKRSNNLIYTIAPYGYVYT